MKIAVCSDEAYPIHAFVQHWLKSKGYTLLEFGSFKTQEDASWVEATEKAAEAIKEGICDQGIFFCWSGTGASIAANKVKGVRAALCWDAETARLAKLWNHANALVLPNRTLIEPVIDSILEAWFAPYDFSVGLKEIKKLEKR